MKVYNPDIGAENNMKTLTIDYFIESFYTRILSNRISTAINVTKI